MALKKLNKLLIIFSLTLINIIGQAQTNGFAIDMQYEQRIQDARRNKKQMENIYEERYKKFKNDYTYALGLNEVKENPKVLPNNGRFSVIITNTGNIFEKAEVVILNNKVTTLITSKGENFTTVFSSEIENFRSIIKLSEDLLLEVIFTDLYN